MIGDDAVNTAVEQTRHVLNPVCGIWVDAEPGLVGLIDEFVRHKPHIRIDGLRGEPSGPFEDCDGSPRGDQQRDSGDRVLGAKSAQHWVMEAGKEHPRQQAALLDGSENEILESYILRDVAGHLQFEIELHAITEAIEKLEQTGQGEPAPCTGCRVHGE